MPHLDYGSAGGVLRHMPNVAILGPCMTIVCKTVVSSPSQGALKCQSRRTDTPGRQQGVTAPGMGTGTGTPAVWGSVPGLAQDVASYEPTLTTHLPWLLSRSLLSKRGSRPGPAAVTVILPWQYYSRSN